MSVVGWRLHLPNGVFAPDTSDTLHPELSGHEHVHSPGVPEHGGKLVLQVIEVPLIQTLFWSTQPEWSTQEENGQQIFLSLLV
tara:strand:- start:109 stop:357 length:249 start_codon:yes stop_codon:yes gene_type:complete